MGGHSLLAATPLRNCRNRIQNARKTEG
jgi:hypothetical protein